MMSTETSNNHNKSKSKTTTNFNNSIMNASNSIMKPIIFSAAALNEELSNVFESKFTMKSNTKYKTNNSNTNKDDFPADATTITDTSVDDEDDMEYVRIDNNNTYSSASKNFNHVNYYRLSPSSKRTTTTTAAASPAPSSSSQPRPSHLQSFPPQEPFFANFWPKDPPPAPVTPTGGQQQTQQQQTRDQQPQQRQEVENSYDIPTLRRMRQEAEAVESNKEPVIAAIRKGAVAAVGGTMVGVGLVMIPLPTPFGAVIASSGLAVLGTEFESAKEMNEKLIDKTKAGLETARETIIRTIETMDSDSDKDDDDEEDYDVRDFGSDAGGSDGGGGDASSTVPASPDWLYMNPMERKRQGKLLREKYKRETQTTYSQTKEYMQKTAGSLLSRTVLPLLKRTSSNEETTSTNTTTTTTTTTKSPQENYNNISSSSSSEEIEVSFQK